MGKVRETVKYGWARHLELPLPIESTGARAGSHNLSACSASLDTEDGLLFLYYLDVLPPDEIVCRKRHQIFGHARLSTLLGEPYAPFG